MTQAEATKALGFICGHLAGEMPEGEQFALWWSRHPCRIKVDVLKEFIWPKKGGTDAPGHEEGKNEKQTDCLKESNEET